MKTVEVRFIYQPNVDKSFLMQKKNLLGKWKIVRRGTVDGPNDTISPIMRFESEAEGIEFVKEKSGKRDSNIWMLKHPTIIEV